MSGVRLLVVGAHSADFVWRAGGVVANNTSAGGTSVVVALSFGERGESGELWKLPEQTEQQVKDIRRSEAEKAAALVGAELVCMDLGDYPLVVDDAALERLRDVIRRLRPEVVITHPAVDPFNPDHPVAHEATRRARLLSSGAGVASAFETVPPSQFFLFEPHQPELCGFIPTTFVDITASFETKRRAMEAMEAQKYLQQYYTERAGHRGNHARKVTGDSSIGYAEAFQRITPQVVSLL
ncbi:PIG-L family deacetylase [Acidiferrimicrobium sp. IK]|uniref:PIG-L deacetylase family protein n=1 Tax=Acidiferrimicrobium sp. IK TaxID=2871700 RepID=UPI0021CAEB11|nr:PIG-L deacetylase family protein [Acidiferrimicrobium sp. IK]MCU4184222.1 PIG-L family deacetylase [Acidiferrimicrobium sp. IK]